MEGITMEKHLLTRIEQKLNNIKDFVRRIDRYINNVEEVWEKYHDPAYQNSVVNPQRFVYKMEEFRNNNVVPLRREVEVLFSENITHAIKEQLQLILGEIEAIKAELSKGMSQIRGSEGWAYRISKEHITQKTRHISEIVEVISGIIKTYVE